MTGRVQWSHLPPSPRPGSPISVGGASTLPGSLGFGRSSSVMSSSSRSSSGSSGYVSPFGPVETPRYANSLPRKSGASNHVGPVKVQPPFINPMIEILVAAKDCAEYNFEVKLFAPTSRELKKVTGVHLPALANLPYYVPPPVTDVMSISFGTSGKPVYGVEESNRSSPACIGKPPILRSPSSHRCHEHLIWNIGKASLWSEDELRGFSCLSSCLF